MLSAAATISRASMIRVFNRNRFQELPSNGLSDPSDSPSSIADDTTHPTEHDMADNIHPTTRRHNNGVFQELPSIELSDESPRTVSHPTEPDMTDNVNPATRRHNNGLFQELPSIELSNESPRTVADSASDDTPDQENPSSISDTSDAAFEEQEHKARQFMTCCLFPLIMFLLFSDSVDTIWGVLSLVFFIYAFSEPISEPRPNVYLQRIEKERHPGVKDEVKKQWYRFVPKKLGNKKGREHEGDVEMGQYEYEEDLCSICLCDYDYGEIAVKIPCGHVYHDCCLSVWTEHHVRCPLCNIDLNLNKHVVEEKDTDEVSSGASLETSTDTTSETALSDASSVATPSDAPTLNTIVARPENAIMIV